MNLIIIFFLVAVVFIKPIKNEAKQEEPINDVILQPQALSIYEKWSFPISTDTAIWSSPSTFDLDRDGYLESIFGTYFVSGPGDNKIYCINQTGDLEWSYDTEHNFRSSPAIADIDQDGLPEVIVGSMDSYLNCLNLTGGLE